MQNEMDDLTQWSPELETRWQPLFRMLMDGQEMDDSQIMDWIALEHTRKAAGLESGSRQYLLRMGIDARAAALADDPEHPLTSG